MPKHVWSAMHICTGMQKYIVAGETLFNLILPGFISISPSSFSYLCLLLPVTTCTSLSISVSLIIEVSLTISIY